MSLLQLVYSSTPFGFNGPTLAGILFDARRCNIRDGITGALICRDDLFLQMLEGPATAVEAAYDRIRRDDRHVDVRPLTRSVIEADRRLFGNWAMRDDPAQSWIWSRKDLEDGALDRATSRDVLAIFEQLAAINA